jgi:hypothetical protein
MHVRPDASRTVLRGKYAVEAAPSLITRLTEHAHAVCWPGLGVRALRAGPSPLVSQSRYFARAGCGRVHRSSKFVL